LLERLGRAGQCEVAPLVERGLGDPQLTTDLLDRASAARGAEHDLELAVDAQSVRARTGVDLRLLADHPASAEGAGGDRHPRGHEDDVLEHVLALQRRSTVRSGE
jgi:hypothetical protein